ncbi:Retrovirus-related Pol polyprotein from transposon TNT 1-94 [Vitis vinifera]|uniref:Retrovirus-related Pol polyprotein from transposon TNT 1-94 n=1 Tax=Vitis vinifera TaxID=29760 RepID=A0A438CXU8_VITVI|nr:Retrovirus-related Pol polyprotein from transposon TNT 1-94 [Vitis vinifera]
MTKKTMRNRGFEPWTFRSCLGYQHFVINDNNRDQRKKDSKKTSIATVAEIKTEANVAEKASALVAATDHGGKFLNTFTPVINSAWIIDSGATDHMTFDSRQDIQTRQTIGCGIKWGKLYYLDLQSKDSNKLQQALMADGSEGEKKKSEIWLWHRRLGHASFVQCKGSVLRSDNGGEYQSSDLQKYLEGHGIIHQTTCSNTPQQNGVAERKNRHLLEVVRASLIAAKTPISYWGEAITSAAYLINRVPSSSINFQTPLQALTNAVVAPTVPNLPPRVFGCAFVHLHKHQRTKLTSHALQWEYHKEIQTLDYDYHISEENESGQSELVNQKRVIGYEWSTIWVKMSSLKYQTNRRLLKKNETWELVECPPGKKPVGCRWIYTVKYKADGSIERFKARLVAKGYTQTYGIDYTETFAPVAKINTDAWCQKSNVKGVQIEEVIVWVEATREHGLEVTGNDPEERKALQNYLSREFEMKDLGPLKYFLGIEVSRSSEGIFLSQRKYALDLLQETGMSGCQPVNTPIEKV